MRKLIGEIPRDKKLLLGIIGMYAYIIGTAIFLSL